MYLTMKCLFSYFFQQTCFSWENIGIESQRLLLSFFIINYLIYHNNPSRQTGGEGVFSFVVYKEAHNILDFAFWP